VYYLSRDGHVTVRPKLSPRLSRQRFGASFAPLLCASSGSSGSSGSGVGVYDNQHCQPVASMTPSGVGQSGWNKSAIDLSMFLFDSPQVYWFTAK